MISPEEKEEISENSNFEGNDKFFHEKKAFYPLKDEVAKAEVYKENQEENLFLTKGRSSERKVTPIIHTTFNLNKKMPSKKEAEQVNFQSFTLIRNLGKGAFGSVFMAENKETKKIFAMKVLKKKILILKRQLKYAEAEANVLKKANCPFIVKLWYTFQTPLHLYLIMEYCPKGDLSYYLAEDIFTEDVAKFYMAEIIIAIQYLHDMNVVYRDLKPENILVDADGHIKLADFGLCKEGIKDEDKAKSFCGSPVYLQPEAIEGKGVGKSGDLFTLGIVLYEMLVGSSPFMGDELPGIYKKIQELKVEYPRNISPESKKLIEDLLKRDPNKRLGSKKKADLRNHQFFNGINWEDLKQKKISPPEIICDYDMEDETYHEAPKFFDKDYTENDKIGRIPNWSFSREEAE